MKNNFSILVFSIFLLSGCGLSVGINGATKKIYKLTKKVEIGMSLSDFKKAVPKARRVYHDHVTGKMYRKDGEVYRLIVNYSYVGYDGNRWQLVKDFGFLNDNTLDEIGRSIEVQKR